MIPKIIHYIWFGHNEKPEIVIRCLDTWKKYMPDYRIIEWNEENYDINKNIFISEAYANKKYAFVSDYVRFDVLYQYGGIYFDTDVELLKPIPEEILKNYSFTGFESAGKVAPGLVFATEKNNTLLNTILNKYDGLHFDYSDPQKILVNNILTELLSPLGLKNNNSIQSVGKLVIYPSCYFCGFDQDIGEPDICDKTICVHHYAGTWKTKTIKQGLRSVIKKIIGVKGYRRILDIYRRLIKHC